MENAPSAKPSLFSRRSILAGGLAAVGFAAGTKIAHDLRRIAPEARREHQEATFIDEAELSEPHASDPWEPAGSTPENEEADRRELAEFSGSLSRFEHTFHEAFGDVETGPGGSWEAQEEARTFLLQSGLPRQLRRIVPILTRYPSGRGTSGGRMYFDLLNVFGRAHCQGLVYAALTEASGAQGGEVSFARNGTYYASRMRDFTPSAEHLWSQDIDPRNRPDTPADTRRNIQASPAWSGKRHKQLFRKLAERPGIAEQAKREDLTVVEYFSLLKAIFHERAKLDAEQRAQERLEMTAARLLQARRGLMERKVLSSETEKAILFYGNDRRLIGGVEDGGWDGTIEAVGLPSERIERVGTSATRMETGAELSKLEQAIASSRGKTFVSFKTHGADRFLVLDQQAGPEHVTDQLLANALFSRLRATRDPRTLGDVNIVIDACHSYDYAKNVVGILKRLWEVSPFRALPFERVRLPFIVTVVQEGATGQGGSLISSRLDDQFAGIQADGAVTGRRLLQNVQPIIYEENDMTFFAPDGGTEFSRRLETTSVVWA